MPINLIANRKVKYSLAKVRRTAPTKSASRTVVDQEAKLRPPAASTPVGGAGMSRRPSGSELLMLFQPSFVGDIVSDVRQSKMRLLQNTARWLADQASAGSDSQRLMRRGK